MVGFAPPAGNADAAYRYFLARGWTPAQAAGIVGNLQQESGPGLDPTIVGDGGNAFGIAQWNDRRDALHGWAQSGGMDPAALQTQLDFISHELNTTEGRAAAALRGAQTPEEAARAFLGFERPQGFSWADPTGSHGYQNRVANALRLYGGGTMPQPMSSMPAPGPAAGGQSMAGGGLLGVQPPALRQSWLGGLLGVEPSADQGILGSFLNPQGSADRLGLLGLAANLLQASGPSTDPSHGSFGSALGAGLQGYVAGSETGAKRDERDRRKAAIDAMLSGAGGNPQIAALAAAFPEQYGAAMLQQAFQGPAQPIEINGQLVDPTNMQVLGDFRTPERAPQPDAPPALIASLQAAGIDPASPEGRAIVTANLGGAAPNGGMFQGNSVDAQALNYLVSTGQLTPEQAAQVAAGRAVIGPNGQLSFATPQALVGAAGGGQGGTMTASAPGVPGPAPGVIGVTPPTGFNEGQDKAASYADRMYQAQNVLGTLEGAGTNVGDALMGSVPLVGNFLTSPDYQQYQQAGREFIAAMLRRDSGAAVTQQEFDYYSRMYLPQPGDSPEVVAQKKSAREAAYGAMVRGAGPAYVMPGQPGGNAGAAAPGSASAATPAAPLPPPTGATLNTTPALPAVGQVVDGWRFKGGNPADPASWEQVP